MFSVRIAELALKSEIVFEYDAVTQRHELWHGPVGLNVTLLVLANQFLLENDYFFLRPVVFCEHTLFSIHSHRFHVRAETIRTIKKKLHANLHISLNIINNRNCKIKFTTSKWLRLENMGSDRYAKLAARTRLNFWKKVTIRAQARDLSEVFNRLKVLKKWGMHIYG